jgi:uncharacterized membrane protein
LRYITGILELTGALLIVVPNTRRGGAALLASIMPGALTAPVHLARSTHALAVRFLMSGFVVWGRR